MTKFAVLNFHVNVPIVSAVELQVYFCSVMLIKQKDYLS